ncbi:hypothetical protein [Agromyces neolithicus]|uniref:DUF2207 domain-containing protein n=1 Tax=Agromyces neolithicus TaxID=269420 RepID=A0ABP4YKR8_9MICO
MGRSIFSALPQVIVDLADAGSGSDALAASADGGLGVALLPLFALAGALIAAVAVATLIVEWLRKPEADSAYGVTDPESAGLLHVGFVSGAAATRWLPATVLQLADDGVIAIVDRRENGDDTATAATHIRLVLDGDDPAAVPAGAGSGDAEGSVVVAMLAPGLTGDSSIARRGSSVDVDRVVSGNAALLGLTRDRFAAAAAWYREPRPVRRFRAATAGGVLGVVLGLFSTVTGEEYSTSIAWSAVVIGAVALSLRALLPRWIPLNAAGLQLRQRASDLRERITRSDVPSLTTGRDILPWAVLFDESSVVQRFAEVAERSGVAPAWYRSSAPLSADRLASCLAVVVAQLAQPIRVGGRPLGQGDDSRFGVPMIGDSKGWGGGYLAGDGGGAYPGYGYGDGGGGFGDGGGGFGGFDGGGGGGGDG